MSFNKKASETGWFYHAPAKPNASNEPVSAPPASQIPGLSDLPDQPADDMPKKLWIRDTDSDYIKMAKMGGRSDLLRYRSPKPRSEGPQGYPRCEWYYHDEALDAGDANPPSNEPHDFLLPDYMVHQEWNPTGDKSPTKRAPYASDETSVYSREGTNPTDKTVKLPEIRPSGYGVRSEKHQGRNPKHAPIQRPQAFKPMDEHQSPGKTHYEPVPSPKEEERPVMGKLLSHGYVSEWESERQKWSDKQKNWQDRQDSRGGPTHKDKIQTEYQEKMKSSLSGAKVAAGVTTHKGNQGSNSKGSKQRQMEQERELFKLSKFKNVSAKTNSRRSSNPITHSDPIDGQTAHQSQPVY